VSRLLSWRAAEYADRSALQQFSCTVPAQRVFLQKRSYHPKPWELEVQSGLRALRPPVGEDQSLLLGEDAGGIAAVCLLAAQAESAMVVKIQAIAIATRYRGQFGAHADEALDVALEAAAARGSKSGVDAVTVIGLVHPRNIASKRLNERAGFTHVGNVQAGLEQWAIILDLA
jgi:hypothetical protein